MYLTLRGLKFVQQNFICSCGEIDLIMLASTTSNPTLVFIEVRYRRDAYFGSAEGTIDIAKQQRLIRSAQMFLLSNSNFQQHLIRFDVVAFNGRQIQWIKHAFEM